MGFIQDFKEFAFKGNLIDMAVGIVMGTAVAAMVKSFLENIISPVIAVVAGVPDMSSMKYPLAQVDVKNDAGELVKETAFINYGTFIQNTIDFTILALVIFIAIKIASSYMDKAEEDEEPSDEVKLLTEIRDSLANRA